MKPKSVPENNLPLNQRILVQRRTQMEIFPTCSLLASSPVIIMLLLWYSESVLFGFSLFFSLLLLLFMCFLHLYPFLFFTLPFLERSCLHRSVGHLHVLIFLQFQSYILFPVEAKKANVLKLTLFRHECCGQNTPGICRQLKSNWKYVLCFR